MEAKKAKVGSRWLVAFLCVLCAVIVGLAIMVVVMGFNHDDVVQEQEQEQVINNPLNDDLQIQFGEEIKSEDMPVTGYDGEVGE